MSRGVEKGRRGKGERGRVTRKENASKTQAKARQTERKTSAFFFAPHGRMLNFATSPTMGETSKKSDYGHGERTQGDCGEEGL